MHSTQMRWFKENVTRIVEKTYQYVRAFYLFSTPSHYKMIIFSNHKMIAFNNGFFRIAISNPYLLTEQFKLSEKAESIIFQSFPKISDVREKPQETIDEIPAASTIKINRRLIGQY